MDGITAASSANATAQLAAAVQVFALKQANEGQAAMLDTLLRAMSSGPANLGNRVDVSV